MIAFCSSRYDVEVGAGTMHPETFLRVLGPAPGSRRLRAAVPAACRRPVRREPNRLFKHHQFQVILKPSPDDVQQLYLESLEAVRHQSAAARHSLRRGQLGVADARRVGNRLAGPVRRPGDHAVHVFSAVRRPRTRPDFGRADLRSRANRGVSAGRRQRLRRALVEQHDLSPGAHGRRAAIFSLQL